MPAQTVAGTSITERLVTALTSTWRAIQERHPDVPEVVLTLGSGTLGARRGEVTWGHFAAGRWHTTEHQQSHHHTDGHDEAQGSDELEESTGPGVARAGGAVRGR